MSFAHGASLLFRFWRAEVVAELEYRTNFFIAILASGGNVCGAIFSLRLFYQRGYTFPGWSFIDGLAVLGTFIALNGFNQALLTPNLSHLVEHVERGTLDFVLLKPVDSQFWVSLRHLSPWGFPDLVVGLCLLVYVGHERGVGATGALVALAPLAASAVLLYSLWFLLAAMSLWFVKSYNASDVLRGFLEAGRYPITAYPATWRCFFTFVVPVGFLTTVPAEALLGRSAVSWLAAAVALAALAFLTSRAIWHLALRSYTSASS